MRFFPLHVVTVCFTLACTPAPRAEPDATSPPPPDAGALPDAAVPDAAHPDAAPADAGVPDAAVPDAADASASADAGVDAGPWDAGVDAGLIDAGPVDAGPVDAGARQRIRIMAANTTSGTSQSYDPGHGIRIFQGLQPDIALVQEFSYGNDTPADLRTLVDTAFGPEFDFHVEDGATTTIPNAVVSRWPIVESGVWEDTESPNREFAWARIDIPGDVDLWAVSLHLLTRSAGARNTEAGELVDYIEDNVPVGDYLVIGGDLNTESFTESGVDTLGTVVDVTGRPADQDANPYTNTNRNKPYDQLLPDEELVSWEVPVVIGENTFPTGLVFDSRVYTPLSDVTPVLADDSGATNMQHMPVVRDFAIPAP